MSGVSKIKLAKAGRQAPRAPVRASPFEFPSEALERLARLVDAFCPGATVRVAADHRTALTGASSWLEDVGGGFEAAAPVRRGDQVLAALVVRGAAPAARDASLAARLQDLADMLGASAQTNAVDIGRKTVMAIVSASPIALVLTDKDLRILAASPPWMKARGISADRVIGRTIPELLPTLASDTHAVLARALAGEKVTLEQLVPRLDGRHEVMHAEIAPWRTPTGEIAGLILLSKDITVRAEAMERLERSEARLQLALEIADIHVWEMDYARGELIKAGMEENFFTEPKTYDEFATNLWGTIHPLDRDRVAEEWRQCLLEGRPFRSEYRVHRADEREMWVAGTARAIHDEKGELVRLVGAIQDINGRKAQETALIRAKDEAEMANRAKSAFLATMSHEIRTPLNGVLGMAQAMANGELDPIQRERLQVIRQSGEGLLAILNDVLDLSKIEAGKLTLEANDFDVSELAAGAHATFSALADNKGLEFDLLVEPAARGVYRGDCMRVRQILNNLLSNALKFTDQGAVKVVVSRRGKSLRLTVSDSGIGMSAEQAKRLFQKFEQADASTTRRYGGTGLGLAICSDLVGLMGGEISARSTQGAGSTFVVSLPLPKVADSKDASMSEAPGAAADVAERPLRILAAEDNSMNQFVLKTLLGQAGVEPVMVFDGKAAVDAWAEADWDLILMDVRMPVMDGPTATALIREREKAEGRGRTPILALTANAMEHQVADYLAVGMDGFIAKPIEAGRLFAAIEAALEPGGEDTKASAAA